MVNNNLKQEIKINVVIVAIMVEKAIWKLHIPSFIFKVCKELKDIDGQIYPVSKRIKPQ